jgi:hypothetical protein
MGLKFRRGTTAQQSGSLAFGEPYVNTTLGTLVIGGATGDIVLSSAGTGSTGNFGAISGSGLDITGNANIGGNLVLGGNITIGDNTADSVNVVASLSSSLIPQTDNIFDLGSLTKAWRDLYISTGSIKMVSNGVVVSTLSNTGNGFLLDQGVTARGDSSFGTSSAAVTSVTGSLKVSGSISLIGALSASTITGIGNVSLYSTSVDSRLVTVEAVSASVKAVTDTFATSASVASATATSITSLSSSVKAVTDTFATSASVASATATSISTLSGSVKTVTDALSGRVTTLEGTDISITLTGDVTGTGTITNLANVSFATTIAANSVALGTDTTGDYVASMTAGTGITVGTATGEGSTPVITNTGVTSNVAGTGISVSGGTGAVTITNSGVTSAVAGTGVSVSAGTGAVTFSIGQAVATNSAVTFASVAATGDIVAYSSSDRRFKNNIVNISDALNKVKQLNGVTWEWNDDVNDVTKSSPKTGLIAQEVQEVLPEVVSEREDGYLGLDYSKMVGLLVEAIKEQQTQIAELKAEVEALKK